MREARDAWRFLIKWGLFWILMLNIPVVIAGIFATDDAGLWAGPIVVIPIFIALVLQIPARKARDFIEEDDGERALLHDPDVEEMHVDEDGLIQFSYRVRKRDLTERRRPGPRGRADRSPSGVRVHEGAPGRGRAGGAA